MDKFPLNKKCRNHPNLDFEFFCFDDKTFLCENCLKQHKKHNFELKNDLVSGDFSYKYLRNVIYPLTDVFNQIKEELLKLRDFINKELEKINVFLLKEKLNFIKNKKNIFDLTYEEYEDTSEIWNSYNIFNSIVKKIEKIQKFPIFRAKAYSNLQYLNDKLKVTSSSLTHPQFPIDIMLNRSKGEYTLFQGDKNHFIIFDLLNDKFVKNLRLKEIKNYNCTPKNFTITIKKDNGIWEKPKNFIGKEYFDDYQYFDISEEARYIKIMFIDVWGNNGGNYILIKELALNIANIIS